MTKPIVNTTNAIPFFKVIFLQITLYPKVESKIDDVYSVSNEFWITMPVRDSIGSASNIFRLSSVTNTQRTENRRIPPAHARARGRATLRNEVPFGGHVRAPSHSNYMYILYILHSL